MGQVRHTYFGIVFLTLLINFNAFAASSTFSGLGGDNTGGTGFKTIDNISGVVVSNNLNHIGTEIYGSENGVGATEVLVLKADGVNAESFTFNDLQVFNFTGSSTWTTSTIEFKDKTGADIQVMSNPNALTTSTVSIGTLYTSNNSLPIVGVAEVRINLSGGGSPSNFTLASLDVSNLVAPVSSDNSGTLVAAGGVSEPINLPSTSQVGSPLSVFDFQINDGGAGDGLSLDISQINVSLSGTASANFSKMRFNLTGCASKSAVQQSGGIVSFTATSVSIPDGDSTTCTVEAYWADNTALTDNQTLTLSIDGDSDLTLDASKTQMTGTNVAVATGNMLTAVTAAELVFTTQPAGSVSGAALTTQPVITAKDAAGNTDTDFTELVTLSEASAGTLSGDIDVTAVNGVATFTNVVYSASADHQSFSLSADDETGVGDDLPVSTANAITSDVVATKLIFTTQPAPLSISSGALTSFTTEPVVHAADANNIFDTDYTSAIVLSEANGLGDAVFAATTDLDGDSATVTMNATAGSATFSGLKINYSLSGAGPETFNLLVSDGALTTSQSNQLTASDTMPPAITSIAVSGSPNAASSSVSFVVNFDKTANNVSTDDFELFSTNTAAGAITSVSASSGTSLTVTVNSIVGLGALRLDLKNNTNITDNSGNGNGTNGYVAAFNAGSSHTVDRVGPTITAITIADSVHKVGDSVTATITVASDTDDYTAGAGGLNTSTINGYTLGSLAKVNDTTYTALFTIANGGTDIAAGGDIPVNVTIKDSLGNIGNTYITVISQANDAIYANNPVINLATDKVNIAENAGVAVLSANLSGSLNNNWPADIDVNLNYSGTAVNPDDYSRTAKIVISANNSVGTINITGIADSHFDAAVDETVIVDISTVSIGSIGTTSQQVITINDEQSAPTVSLSVDNTNINENSGNAVVTATLNNATFAPVNVSLSYSGTATLGADFNNTVSNSIVIPANTVSKSVDIAITSIDDTVEEGSETIVVDVSAVSGGGATESGTQQQTITILDDDDTTAPLISNIVVPVAKTYKTGDNLDFTVNTDEVTLVNTAGGTPRLQLTIGSTTKYASYISGSNSQALLFRYTVEAEIFDDNGIALTSFDINGATVRDAAGNDINSALNGVGDLTAVFVDSVSPKVTSVSSNTNNGAYKAGSSINITVEFDKNVTVTTTLGTPSIALNAQSAAKAVYSSGSNSDTLTFNYTVQPGDNSSDLDFVNTNSFVLNSAVIEDVHGNNATLTLPTPGLVNSLSNNKDLIIDTVAPVVPAITSPLSNTLVNNAFATITGTHSENAVKVHVYQDTNQDGQADNNTSLVSAEVNSGTWTLNAPVTPGINSFVVTAVDAATNTSNDVKVALITRNSAPQISGTPNTSVSMDSSYTFTPTASDLDGDTLTFSIINQPSWASFDTSTGELSGVPTRADVGQFTNVTISVSDGALSAVLPAFTIEVLDVNGAPIISGTPATTVDEGKAYSFTPIASDVDGDTLTFSIINKPSWATFNASSGILSGIPSASDIGVTSGIIITVSDGVLSASLPAFNIEVLNVNEAPVLDDQNVSVDEDSSLIISLNAKDADNDELTFEVTSEPLFGQVSVVGSSVVYTPSVDYFGSDQFSVIADDGELASEPAVIIIDIKPVNDAPIAVDDVFTQAYSEAMLYTLDVLANDSDVDGDVLRVMAVSSDIGSVNIVDNQLVYQAMQGGPEQVNLSYTLVDQGDEVAKANVVLTITDQETEQLPIINAPDTINVDAKGLYTKVNIGIATAEDIDGNPLAVSLINSSVVFKPGKHNVYWYTEDSEGRSRVATQVVNVNPLVSIDKDTTIAEGGEYTTALYLNGDAVSYPVIVDYVVSGSADGNDHDLITGQVTFESRRAFISFTSFEDSEIEGDETLVINLVGDKNFAENSVQTITISEANIAPTVKLVTMQGEQMQAIVGKQNGEVLIKANVTDANLLDVVTLTWQSELFNTSSDEHMFSFDPSVVSAGIYKISAIATDNGVTPLSTERSAYIEVREELTQLDEQIDSDGDLISDAQEGYRDSDSDGIPDYLDAIVDCNVIQQHVEQQRNFLVEGEAGVCIRKGLTAVNNQSGGVLLFRDELIADDDAVYRGGIVDFIVEGLKESGQSYQLVFPQNEAVPENAIYRKVINEQWQDFVIDDHNQIHTTSGEFGYCPAPGDISWTPGLTAGHWCVQITIQDGGANDADGQANGTIIDPSGVAVMNMQNTQPIAESDAVAMPWNSTLVIDVLANDSDEDGDTLTINSVAVDFGIINIESNQLHYTAPIDFLGTATIQYSISDGQGGSANSTVTVTVNTNFAPSAKDDSAETDDKTAINIAVLVNDSDPDGDALTVTSASVDSGSVVINADNTLTFTPQEGSATTATIEYAISDGRYTASAKVMVTVMKAQNPPPPEPSEPVSKKSSGGFTFTLLLLLISAATMRRRFKY
mgnify:CR=1 FL=1